MAMKQCHHTLANGFSAINLNFNVRFVSEYFRLQLCIFVIIFLNFMICLYLYRSCTVRRYTYGTDDNGTVPHLYQGILKRIEKRFSVFNIFPSKPGYHFCLFKELHMYYMYKCIYVRYLYRHVLYLYVYVFTVYVLICIQYMNYMFFVKDIVANYSKIN